MTKAVRLRLFLDSNVLTGGILAPRGPDKAVLSPGAAHICRMVLADVVRQEVETNLLSRASGFGEKDASPRYRALSRTDQTRVPNSNGPLGSAVRGAADRRTRLAETIYAVPTRRPSMNSSWNAGLSCFIRR